MRTENDTWDIKTSVGSTALFVAAARAVEAQKLQPAAVDPYAEVFCREVGGEWADLLDGNAPEHPLKTEFGNYFVPMIEDRRENPRDDLISDLVRASDDPHLFPAPVQPGELRVVGALAESRLGREGAARNRKDSKIHTGYGYREGDDHAIHSAGRSYSGDPK